MTVSKPMPWQNMTPVMVTKPVYRPPLLSTQRAVEGRGVVDLTKKRENVITNIITVIMGGWNVSDRQNNPLLFLKSERSAPTTPLLYVYFIRSQITAHTQLSSHPFDRAIVSMAKINSLKPRTNSTSSEKHTGSFHLLPLNVSPLMPYCDITMLHTE